MILGLLTGQVAVIATIGALAGVGTGVAVIAVAGDPLPPIGYVTAVAAALRHRRDRHRDRSRPVGRQPRPAHRAPRALT